MKTILERRVDRPLFSTAWLLLVVPLLLSFFFFWLLLDSCSLRWRFSLGAGCGQLKSEIEKRQREHQQELAAATADDEEQDPTSKHPTCWIGRLRTSKFQVVVLYRTI